MPTIEEIEILEVWYRRDCEACQAGAYGAGAGPWCQDCSYLWEWLDLRELIEDLGLSI
jgi:hypothetical protein